MIKLLAVSLFALLVAGCAGEGGTPTKAPSANGSANLPSGFVDACPEAANWSFPQDDAGWEALIRASRYWEPRPGLPANFCTAGSLGFYAAYLGAAYPDDTPAQGDQRYNLMVQRALGGSP
jgi:hypothetical protein